MINAFLLEVVDEKTSGEHIQKTHEIICSVSSKENLALFQMAGAGVRYNFSLLERLGISRKQYYKGLRALKDAGLVRKFGSRYFHTTLGRLVYHEILKIEKYTDHLSEMKMIDVLKDSGQFSQNEMSDFIRKVSDKEHDPALSDIVGGTWPATHRP